MEQILSDFFKDSDVLWRKKTDLEYVCVSDSFEILERCMDFILDKDDMVTPKMILVKDILKRPEFGNMNDSYFNTLVRALKQYKVDGILDSPDLEVQNQLEDFIQTKPIKKSKLYITCSK